MSPAPARTSTDAIVAAARRILEADGLPGVTMRSVAEAVGVKGPSLYKRVPDRAALVRAVADGVVADLSRTLARADARPTIRATDLRAVATEYRAFVLRNPNGYRPAVRGPAARGEPGSRRRVAGLWAMPDRPGDGRARPGEAVALEGARTMVALGARLRDHGAGGRVPPRRRHRRGLRVRDRVDPGGRQRAGDPSITLRTNRIRRTPTTSASAPMSLGCADCTISPPPGSVGPDLPDRSTAA